MQPETVGTWGALGLVAVGLFALVRASLATKTGERAPIWAWVFGLAAAGVGTYGPVFLRDLGDFLDPLLALQREPSAASYQSFLAKSAKGELPIEVQTIGVHFMVEHPLLELDQDLARAAVSAQSQATKDLFHQAQKEVAAKDAKAEAILQVQVNATEFATDFDDGLRVRDLPLVVPNLAELDPGTLRLLDQKLARYDSSARAPRESPDAFVPERPARQAPILIHPKQLKALQEQAPPAEKPKLLGAGLPR